MTENNRYLDFDAFRQEQKQEYMEIKVYGEVEKLPSSPPAELILDVMSLTSKDQSASVGVEQIRKMTIGLFGQPLLDKWFSKGMKWDELEQLMKMVMDMYYKPQRKYTDEQVTKNPNKS